MQQICYDELLLTGAGLRDDMIYRSCGQFCHSSSLWLEIEEQLLRLSIILPAKLLQTFSSVKNICKLNFNWADYLRVALLPKTWILVSIKNAAPFWERSIDGQLAPVHVWLKMMLRCLLKFSRVEGLMERVGESMHQSVMIHIDVEEDEAEANPSWLHAFKTVLKSNVKKNSCKRLGSVQCSCVYRWPKMHIFHLISISSLKGADCVRATCMFNTFIQHSFWI